MFATAGPALRPAPTSRSAPQRPLTMPSPHVLHSTPSGTVWTWRSADTSAEQRAELRHADLQAHFSALGIKPTVGVYEDASDVSLRTTVAVKAGTVLLDEEPAAWSAAGKHRAVTCAVCRAITPEEAIQCADCDWRCCKACDLGHELAHQIACPGRGGKVDDALVQLVSATVQAVLLPLLAHGKAVAWPSWAHSQPAQRVCWDAVLSELCTSMSGPAEAQHMQAAVARNLHHIPPDQLHTLHARCCPRPTRCARARASRAVAAACVHRETLPSPQQWHALVARVKSNAFPLTVPGSPSQQAGWALLPRAAACNHAGACSTAVVIAPLNRARMQLVTVHDVPAGAPVTIPYLAPTVPPADDWQIWGSTFLPAGKAALLPPAVCGAALLRGLRCPATDCQGIALPLREIAPYAGRKLAASTWAEYAAHEVMAAAHSIAWLCEVERSGGTARRVPEPPSSVPMVAPAVPAVLAAAKRASAAPDDSWLCIACLRVHTQGAMGTSAPQAVEAGLARSASLVGSTSPAAALDALGAVVVGPAAQRLSPCHDALIAVHSAVATAAVAARAWPAAAAAAHAWVAAQSCACPAWYYALPGLQARALHAYSVFMAHQSGESSAGEAVSANFGALADALAACQLLHPAQPGWIARAMKARAMWEHT